ncbi:DNA repair protein RecO C-terminal domain-containing protein [Novosphingobium sp. SG707]|uniref:DNA repair protein RecO n=1 Tax=Novosphingobium sp. SG707 TaxID=2586996 RepID=UPI001444EB36|nr:DNA repair protein RecO C-terminal domain-containing protein [Novosphingobium sp. SG707]NKJ00836.1 DNA repair protein RecO (recombination protein O) [Novosphingobium sp. SG707]
MHIRAHAILCSGRPHGEVGVIARLMTADHGMVAAYVAGGRGRDLRPVLIPGNGLAVDMRARIPSQMPAAKVELTVSRAPFLVEPLPAAAIGWVTALVAASLPERQAYPALYDALGALLDAVCHAPSARGWAPALLAYEALLLRELGYGERFGAGADGQRMLEGGAWDAVLARFDALGLALSRYLLADRRGDVMGAREILRQRLGRMAA